VTVLLAATAAALFGIGTYLVLQRKLSRIIIGIALLGHGANVLMVTSGDRGRAPLIGNGPTEGLADPLPQALALTAIVISFGVTALLLALAYRSWLLTSDDEVQDDVEDRDVALHGAPDDDLDGTEGDADRERDDDGDAA
jgi:multicomponent Na+:H+ antiporter subunit C